MNEERKASLLNFIRTGNTMRFYKSSEWMALRLVILKRDNFECKRCKGKGKYSKAECVHHKNDIKKYPEQALTESNLLSLCNRCHNEIHGRTAEAFNKKKQLFYCEERW